MGTNSFKCDMILFYEEKNAFNQKFDYKEL